MYLQRRIAKKLQAVVGGKIEEKVFFGTIDRAIHNSTKSKLQKKRLKNKAPPDGWHVTFDVIDDEEEEEEKFGEFLNEDEVHKALDLYSKHCELDPRGVDETSLHLATEQRQKKYTSTPSFHRSRSPLDISESNHNTDSRRHSMPVWPYRSKHNKRTSLNNRGTVACIFLFIFISHNVSNVANQHGNLKQFWMARDALVFDPAQAVRLPNKQHDVDAPLPSARPIDHSKSQNSFSACLLWMDDNHRIPEWLAYHYFALPLRDLVIAVDPHSKSNVNISSYWYDNMNITIWQDSDYSNDPDLARNPNDSVDQLTAKHRKRQSQFYPACCRYLKERNRTYTIFQDTDEFLTISDEYYARSSPQHYHSSPEFKRQPGHIMLLMEDYNHSTDLFGARSQTHEDLAQKCISVPRILYCAVESEATKRDKGVPEWLDANQFDTLRYRHRFTKRGDHDGLGKAIVDVSRLTYDELGEGVGSAHRPVKSVCPRGKLWEDYGSLPLGIHHYLGSWESYAFRDDARKGVLRRRKIWNERAEWNEGGSDDEIREWIEGFVRNTGEVLARELLSGAGLSKADIDEKLVSNHWQEGWE